MCGLRAREGFHSPDQSDKLFGILQKQHIKMLMYQYNGGIVDMLAERLMYRKITASSVDKRRKRDWDKGST